jgi:hypothetical protein
MQELAFQPRKAGAAIGGVAGDGVSNRGKVDPNLVRAAGMERGLDKIKARQSLQDAV